MQDPEIESIDIDEDGHVSASVRLVRCCQECSDELKEATLDLEDDVPEEILHEHEGDGHELSVEEDSAEATEEGGGRYAKSYFGAIVRYAVHCSCKTDSDGNDAIYEGEVSDKVAASHMEELV